MEQNTIPSVFEEMAQEHLNIEYATTWQRFANYMVDIAIYYGYNYLAGMALGFFIVLTRGNTSIIGESLSSKLFLYVFAYFNHVTLFAFIEGATKGRTLGKLITGTKAVKDDITPITWRDALMRSLCRIIPFEPLSGFGAYPWHDSTTNTRVIKNRIL